MIDLRSDYFCYTFKHHVNIVGGTKKFCFDSGTNKTRFYDMLLGLYDAGKLESNKKLVFIDHANQVGAIDISTDSCIILDEVNFAPSGYDNLFEKVKEKNAYLITIGRMFVKQLVCSVDALYRLKLEEGKFSVEPLFSNSCDSKVSTDIFCEDGATIATIYSQYFNTEIIPVGGRSKFYRNIKKCKNPLLIADKPKFSIDLLEILHSMYTKTNSIESLKLYLPACFEQLVLQASCPSIYEENVQQAMTAFDSEDFYEKLLKESVNWWNKNDLVESTRYVLDNVDLTKSALLQDLLVFARGTLSKPTTCTYVVDDSMVFSKQSINAQSSESRLKEFCALIENSLIDDNLFGNVKMSEF